MITIQYQTPATPQHTIERVYLDMEELWVEIWERLESDEICFHANHGYIPENYPQRYDYQQPKNKIDFYDLFNKINHQLENSIYDKEDYTNLHLKILEDNA